MAKCLKGNYNKSTYGGYLENAIKSTQLKDATKVDEFIEKFKTAIKNASTTAGFAINQALTNKEDGYAGSVDDLIKDTIEYANGILSKESNPKRKQVPGLAGEGKSLIWKALKKWLMREGIPSEEEDMIKAVVKNTVGDENFDEDYEVQELPEGSIALATTVDKFFSEYSCLENYREGEFGALMVMMSIVNPDGVEINGIKKQLISSPYELNKSIAKYLRGQYSIVYNFVKDLSGVGHGISSRMFNLDGTISNGYYVTMDVLYNYLINQNNLSSLLFEQYYYDYTGEQDTSDLYKAVMAFMNLHFFEDTLRKQTKGYIQINTKVKSIDPLANAMAFRYGKNAKNNLSRPRFGQETRDQLKETGSFVKLLVNFIPVYNYSTKQKTHNRMTLKEFCGALTKLIDITSGNLTTLTNIKASSANNFVSASLSLDFEKRLIGVLDAIFNTSDNKKLLEWLKKHGVSTNDINYLYSIYHTVFDGNNEKSYRRIQNDHILEDGIPCTEYGIYDTIFGYINSTVSMKYLESKFNYKDMQMETSVKEKYVLNSFIFGQANAINSYTMLRKDRADFISKYKMQYNAVNQSWTITIPVGNTQLTVTIEDEAGNILGKGETRSFIIKEINNLESTMFHEHSGKLSEVNFSKEVNRKKFIQETEPLTENEKKLKAVLEFIGSAINMRFDNDENLKQLWTVLSGNQGDLKKMFLIASRVLAISNIYDSFDKYRQTEEGKKYSLKNLFEYLDLVFGKSGNPYPPFHFIYKSSGSYDRDQRRNEEIEYVTRAQPYGFGLSAIRANDTAGDASWLLHWSQVRAMMNGSMSKATINDLSGNPMPNFSPWFLGYAAKELAARIKQNLNSNMESLMFILDTDLITGVVVNEDVKLQSGLSITVKDMTDKELFYDRFMNKFIIPFLKDGTIYLQPTVLADKTKLVTYAINFKKIINSNTDHRQYVIQLFGKTLKPFYNSVWNKVLNDLDKLFTDIDTDYANDKTSDKAQKIQKKLLTMTEDDMSNALIQYKKKNNGNLDLEIENEVHYRVSNGKLSLNELLYSYATDYFEEESFGIRLNSEMEKFFNDILVNNPGFKSKNEENDPILKILEKFSDRKGDWISGNDMVIAIVRNADNSIAEKRIYGKIDKSKLLKGLTVEYNPVLLLYFLYNSLLSNNLRLCITGSEIGHKVTGYNSLVNNMKQEVGSYFDSDLPNTFFDFDLKIQLQLAKVNAITDKTSDDFNKENGTLTQLKEIRLRYIDKISSRANNTLYKRLVIIPGTMRRFLNDRLNGITKLYKIVVTQDVKANVFNSFELSKIDAHDGSAWLLPFTSILENNALLDNEASWEKKPIMHFMNSSTGCATLLKFATNTITNQIMRDAIGNENGLPMYNIFKKMCNIRWNGKVLLTTVPEWKEEFNFDSDILEKIKDGIELYYQDGDKFFRIVDFGYDETNKVYYTKENEVSYITGNRLEKVEQKTVYHYFNESGDHTRSELILNDSNLHTIDSLFELHKAMGGIYSVQRGSDGQLKSNGGSVNYSENSNYVVAQFMNSVTTVKQEYKDDIINEKKFVPITQETHEQPLKDMCYDMWANLTAVKNGAANINSVKSLYNDDPFLYMVVSTWAYGLQQDSDHVADEATMKEFTQVISALVAGGRNHEYIKLIYRQLGKVAIDVAEEELNAIEEFRNTGDKSDLYDMVGRAIVVDVLRGNRELKGLTTAIMKAIYKKFGRNANHADDKYKIPFSDINIYSRLLPIISNIINKKSIKRSYPGLGTVMSPGYNIEMIYDIDGRTMKFEDVLRESLEDNTITSNEIDLVKKNNDRVKQYLLKRQDEIIKRDRDDNIKAIKDSAAKRLLSAKKSGERDYETATLNLKDQIDKDQQVIDQIKWARNYSIENIDPTDNVYITYKENGVEKVLHVSLNDIYTYYNFKVMGKDGSYDLRSFIAKYANITDSTTISDWWVFRDVTRPRNLAPSKISWDYYEGEGDSKHVRHMNLYDHPSISKNFDSNSKDTVLLRKQATLVLYDELSKGRFTLNGKTYQIFNFKSLAFECITSNMYKSKFGILNQDTLDYINLQGEKYFEDKNHTLITTDTYDMAFTKADGEHLYITFDPVIKEADNESFNFRKNAWRNIKRERMVHDQRVDKKNYKTYERMFAIDEDNMKMFEVARNIYRDDVTYDEKIKKFKTTKKNKDGKQEEVILDDQWKYKVITEDRKQRVIEYVEFVSRYTVYEQGEKYTLYRINHNAIRRCLEQPKYTQDEINNVKLKYSIKKDSAAEANLFNSLINNYLANLLMDIYNQVDYTGIQINGNNNTMSVNSHNILTAMLPRINKRLDTNPELLEYLKYLIECNKAATELKAKNEDKKEYTTGYKYTVKKYKLANYFKLLQHKKFVSFLKALTFTVGRIPGQSMQSFMQMKNVAFTGVDIGQVFVSHWQTWLLGSDYDIDKAYMMGLEFNSNSTYIGWSALFDYSTLLTLQASEFLPDPMQKVYVNNNNGVNINSQIEQVILIENKINYLNTLILTVLTSLDNAKKQTDKDQYTALIKNLTNLKNKTLVKRINAYVDLINYLNKSVTATTQNGGTVYLVNFTDNDKNKAVMANIARHEFTQLSKDNREAALKNFISSHILNTILNIRNYNLANTPITLDDMKYAANNISAKGAITDNMSMLNPMTLIQMQIQNILAKGCVGIAANGEKAAYMFHYYLQDIYENSTADKKKYASFKFETNRILNRNTGNPTKRTILRAPDINKENVKDQLLLKLWAASETGTLTSDEIISQLITIAVDNAKELVLPKVNAGSNFMKCYLFLATMGFQVSDMAAFMCSGAVEFVDLITHKNRFANQSILINDAIKIALGDYSSIYWKVLNVSISDIVNAAISRDLDLKQLGSNSRKQVNLTEKQRSNLDARYTKQLLEGDVTEILKKLQKEVNEFNNTKEKYSGEYYLIKDGIIQALQFIQSIKLVELQCIGMYKTKDAKKDFIADAKELANILEGANEFSLLGKILGMNQGLDATKLDQGKFENTFSYIMGQRVKAVLDYVGDNQDQTRYSDEVILKCEKFEKVDLRKFVLNLNYRKEIKDFYNEIKVTVNIYDVIDSIDQFNSILRLEAFLLDMEQSVTMKSRIYSYITNLLSQQSGVNKGDKIGLQMDDRYIESMLTTIDKIMIENYLVKQSGFEIAHGNAQGIASDYSTKELPQGILHFENLSDIASFKKLFEEYIIPDLKKGTYYTIDKNGNVLKKTNDNVKNNDFIQSLIPDLNGQIPFYKVDIDMSLVDLTIESSTSFNRYLRALHFLHNYKIDNKGHTLADLLVLYNLIVNQNKYGQDRMTRFFDEEVNKLSMDLSPILYEYFQWIGEVDYSGKINETGDYDIQINIMDLLASAARYEAEGNGQYHQNPSYYERRQVGNDYIYILKIRKRAYDYDNGKLLIARNSGETDEQYLERMSNYYLYVTLPGTNAFDALNLIDLLFSSDLNTMLNAIRKLEQDKEIFLLSKYCE